jgi:two-component system CheB/CheR fusion protein
MERPHGHVDPRRTAVAHHLDAPRRAAPRRAAPRRASTLAPVCSARKYEVQERMTDEGESENEGQDPVLVQLEQELQHSREQLATTIEQYETSVEELKASNEELQAINEELRSATEELESSKEELQSVNEELTTVNAELQSRVEDTAKANDDLQNIIVSTDIATVFVDKKIQVKRFTPSATDVKEAFESLKLIEREVQSQDGKWYLMRLLPYRTADDRIDGAVLTLIDITKRHEAEEQARIGEQRLRLVAQSTNDYAIIVQEPSGRIVSWNAGAQRIFGYDEAEVLGKNIELVYQSDDRAANVPAHERETAAKEGRADDEQKRRGARHSPATDGLAFVDRGPRDDAMRGPADYRPASTRFASDCCAFPAARRYD